MVLLEGDVLTPLHASIREDTDKWPEFSLSNVTIVSQETEEPVSLLAAHGGFRVRVEGVLEEIDEENGSLLRSAYQNQIIAIPDVATYSFSLFSDGSFGFWAAGKAGWFEVTKPAKSFKKVFEEMQEATGMFYFLADRLRSSRNYQPHSSVKALEKYVKYLFREYLNSDNCRRDDIDDVRDGFYQHREFLIKSMLEGQEGLSWESSPMFRHFKRTFRDDYKILKEIVRIAQTGLIEKPQTLSQIQKKIGKNQLVNKNSNEEGVVQYTGEEASLDEESDTIKLEELSNPAVQLSNPKKHKRHSILRPKSNKASKKSMIRRHSLRSLCGDQENDNDPDATLSDLSTEDNRLAPNTTTYAYSATTPAGAQPKMNQIPKKVSTKPLWSDHTNNPLPSYYEPHGPGDTWQCPYDGCVYNVWDARNPSSIEMIKKHFVKTHASNAEDLIYQESRPWVSVEHLLERVKGIAELRAQVAPSAKGLPERVIRRY